MIDCGRQGSKYGNDWDVARCVRVVISCGLVRLMSGVVKPCRMCVRSIFIGILSGDMLNLWEVSNRAVGEFSENGIL